MRRWKWCGEKRPGQVSRRKSQRMTVPRLGHDEAVQYLVEYHFGRLPPQMNAALETHIRECRICQRQGLGHAATEKRDIARRLKHIRPGKRRMSRRSRNLILVLAFLAIAQLGVYQLVRTSHISLASILGNSGASARRAVATATPLPVKMLASQATFDPTSSGTIALATSPDGKLVAGTTQGAKPAIIVWNVGTGKAQTTLSWPGTATPGTVAWSPDGQKLVATDGATISAWFLPSTAPAWTATAPEAPALRTYDAQSGAVLQAPSAGTAFAGGSFLLWGANGQLVTAPVGAAGPSGVVTPGTPLIGLWQSNGTHLYADGHGGIYVGVSTADVAGHVALVSWSPDSRYLLWGAVSQPLARAGTGGGVTAPNPVVANVSGALARSTSGDALVWFSPDGHTLAQCTRTAPGAALRLYDIATGNALAQVPGACDHLTVSSLVWVGSDATFCLAIPGQPIAVYTTSASA